MQLVISLDLSWSPHVANLCSKICRECNTLKAVRSYISLVRPHLEAAVGTLICSTIHSVSWIGECPEVCVKICTKHWHHDFLELLEQAQLPTFRIDLSHIYYFPSKVIYPCQPTTAKSIIHKNYNSYYNSFLHIHWNSLPNHVVCATSIREFKGLLCCIL